MDLMALYDLINQKVVFWATVIVVLEASFSLFRKDGVIKLGDLLTNFTISLVYQIVRKALFVGLFAAALSFCAKLSPWQLDPSAVWVWILCFLLVDFLYYWDHRLGHELNILWSFHNIHHSSEHFHLAVASRLSWIEESYRWIFLAPAALVGIPIPVILLTKLFHRYYQFWVHSDYIGKLGWFEIVFVTPSQHRVHHGRNPEYIDKNYGGVLAIWDRLFGTFVEEQAPVSYGLIEQIQTLNPLKIQIIGWQKLAKEMNQSSSWSARWKLLWSPPGTDIRTLEGDSEPLAVADELSEVQNS